MMRAAPAPGGSVLAMGETEHVNVHKLDTEQFDILVNGFASLIAELRIANRNVEAPQAPTVEANCYHDPWTFHDPRRRRDVAAFVDDRNQVRHVPLDELDAVPAGWRKVHLA